MFRILAFETDIMTRVQSVKILHRHTLFLSAAMVVLGLYLEEVQSCIDIGAYAYLLTAEMTHLMTIVHRTVVCIKIHRVIW